VTDQTLLVRRDHLSRSRGLGTLLSERSGMRLRPDAPVALRHHSSTHAASVHETIGV